jgi:hypothetical protein
VSQTVHSAVSTCSLDPVIVCSGRLRTWDDQSRSGARPPKRALSPAEGLTLLSGLACEADRIGGEKREAVVTVALLLRQAHVESGRRSVAKRLRSPGSTSGFSTGQSRFDGEIASMSRRLIEESRAGSPGVAIADRVPPNLAGVHGIDVTVTESSAST